MLLLSGFNVATMGSAQAVFPWTGGVIFEIKDGYLTMDGNSNEAAGTSFWLWRRWSGTTADR